MKQKILLFTLLISLGFSLKTEAQFATAAAYPFLASSKTFNYLIGGTSIGTYPGPSGIIDDDIAYAGVPLGFTFKFAGTNYTTVSVSSNGVLSFLNSTATSPNTNETSLGTVVPAIIPFWEDLQGNIAGQTNPVPAASYQTSGTAPNRVFTWECRNWGVWSPVPPQGVGEVTDVFSFQVKLYENGNIECFYKREGNPNLPAYNLATIGIAKSTTDYQTLSAATASPTSSSTAYNTNINALPPTNQSYFWGCNIPITTDVVSQAVCLGNNATFTCAATGTGLTYQWMVDPNTGTFANISNGGIYSGATTNTLTITAPTATNNNYKYACMIGNGTCSIPTSGGTLSLGSTATSITTQPAAKTSVCQNSNATISVVAAGVGLGYQWQVDPNTGTFANITASTQYPNPNAASLSIVAAPTSISNYKYRCIVTGGCTPLTITSNPDTLTVNAQPVITTQPVSRKSICTNSNSTLTVAATGATTYQWQADPATGTFANISSTGIYTGTATTTLTITSPTTTNNNYKYRVVVNNAANCPINSSPDTLTVLTTVAVTTNPPARSIICEGANGTLVAAGTGSGLAYQWQVDPGTGTYANLTNGAPYSGVNTATLTFTAVNTAINGYRYRCILSGTCTAGVNTNPDTMSIYTAPTITIQPLGKSVCNGDNAVYVVKATGGQLSYQWQEATPTSPFSSLSNSAKYKGTASDTLTVNSATLSQSGYQYQVIVSGYCPSPATSNPVNLIVNDYTAVNYITPSVATCDSIDTKMYVAAAGSNLTYQWQLNPGTSFSNLTNGSAYGGVNTDTLRIYKPTGILSGNLYRVIINGICGNPATSSAVPLTVNAFPQILTDPQDDTVNVGNPATFTISATGTSVNYQWQVYELDTFGYKDLFDNLAYQGTHGPSLTINGTYLSKNGYLYRCIAKGLCGLDDTSASAKLGVGLDTPTSIGHYPSNRSKVSIYPNPVKGDEMVVKIDDISEKDIYLKITDQLGRIVFSENIRLNQNNTTTVNVSRLLPGIYIMQVNDQYYKELRAVRFNKE